MLIVENDLGLFVARVTETPNAAWTAVYRACPLEAVADALTSALFWFAYPEPVERKPKPRKKRRGRNQEKP